MTTAPDLDAALQTAPVFDGHNDLPYALRKKFHGDPAAAKLHEERPELHTDIPRLRQGRVGAQFWSVFVPSRLPEPEAVVQVLEQIDTVERLAGTYPDVFRLALTADDVLAAVGEGRIASLIGMEGGHSIAGSLGVLRAMRRAGAAYMTLTHNDNTTWSASATGEPVAYGLTSFGVEVVREMNRIGMLVDLSHVHEATMTDALDASRAPVIFSHSSCRTVTDHPRDVPDSVLRRLSSNGGILMVTFVPAFVSADPAHATIDDVITHLRHAREVVGIDHVGLGGDFDGVPALPAGIPDVSAYPAILERLSEEGWSTADIQKLTFQNAVRVLSDAHSIADPGWAAPPRYRALA